MRESLSLAFDIEVLTSETQMREAELYARGLDIHPGQETGLLRTGPSLHWSRSRSAFLKSMDRKHKMFPAEKVVLHYGCNIACECPHAISVASTVQLIGFQP